MMKYIEDLFMIRQWLIYNNLDCNQFVLDMKKAGFEIEHYYGRLLYEGPAVRVSLNNAFRVTRATEIDTQLYEESDGSMMVYPVRNGNYTEARRKNEKLVRVITDTPVASRVRIEGAWHDRRTGTTRYRYSEELRSVSRAVEASRNLWHKTR